MQASNEAFHHVFDDVDADAALRAGFVLFANAVERGALHREMSGMSKPTNVLQRQRKERSMLCKSAKGSFGCVT